MGTSKPGKGKHSCHTWLDRWKAYTEWRNEHGVTASSLHQALVNFLVDSDPHETTTPAMLLTEARIIQTNRIHKRGGEE